MQTLVIAALGLKLFAGAVAAEEARTGPAVAGFGEFYRIEAPVEVGDAAAGIRAVFDISVGSADPGELNARIDAVARFLNLHLDAGFPAGRVEAALVLHGTAARDALDAAAFTERYGVPNPNLALLAALKKAGVGIYLCGQSAAHRGFDDDEIAESVDVALSAMTVLLQKQAQGYGLIAF